MKIGFLALSDIRAHDPELLELGLTLPGFVERSKQIAALPSLGLLYLAAVTPEGHELAYFEAPRAGDESDELLGCDLVAISTFSAQIREAYAIADRLRAAGVVVAIGGLHATVLPDEARRHADHVVVGEGEHVWPAVVRATERGEGGRIWRASEFPPIDLATLPVPRYDLLGARPYNRFTVQTSRGCPWRCEFCASSVMLSERYRRRPVEHVVRDVRAVLALRPDAFIEFADDNTFVDKRWGKELCRALAPLGIKWFTETDVSVADDPELVDLLAESGCRQLLIGLESPEASALGGLEQRADFKARRAGDYERAIDTLQSRGVTVDGCFILGLDRHEPTIFDEVYDFARRTALYEVQITYLTPFPGTPLYARLEREGRLLAPGDWERCTLFDVLYQPKRMTADELRAGFHDLTKRLYSHAALRERRGAFFARRIA
ncbi:MAG: B12-binding domain-containing radical SAM protein [Planctomycetes bacterium]|nr:B12-binding domain-containing radical SAM protein [Planctomycetota bacterium]